MNSVGLMYIACIYALEVALGVFYEYGSHEQVFRTVLTRIFLSYIYIYMPIAVSRTKSFFLQK